MQRLLKFNIIEICNIIYYQFHKLYTAELYKSKSGLILARKPK